MAATIRGNGGDGTGQYAVGPVNHYEALGVPVGAAPATIRRAYLDAARRHHPDFHASADAGTREAHARRMQAINHAWSVLGDARARERYDQNIRRTPAPPTERPRAPRDVDVPAGKGWTPRATDDGWVHDYQGWVAEEDRLRPDRAVASRRRSLLTIAPVALFGLGILAIFVGLALTARPLVAGGFAAGLFSAVLFVVMPVIEMSRSRRDASGPR